jgi:hypothetical protein
MPCPTSVHNSGKVHHLDSIKLAFRQSLGHVEVARVVDRGFRPERRAELVVLLDFRVLVVHVQARGDPLGDDPGAEPPGVGWRLRFMILRSKISDTRSGRPRSRLSRISWPKKIRPVTGASGTWVSESSACSTDSS